jgi:hypothetical protein
MNIIKYLRLPLQFDILKLRQDLLNLQQQNWQLHYQTLHYEGNWSALPLRSIDGRVDQIMISPHNNAQYCDTPFLDSSDYFREVLQTFKCPLLAVRLLKLNAGAIIKSHRDNALNFENGEIRLNIPIITHPQVDFYLDKERISLQEGECWYMNFNLLHHIENNSPINRVHLVIDAKVNDWVKTMFASGEVVNRKDISNIPDEETKKQIILSLRSLNTPVSNKMADDMENEQTVFSKQ